MLKFSPLSWAYIYLNMLLNFQFLKFSFLNFSFLHLVSSLPKWGILVIYPTDPSGNQQTLFLLCLSLCLRGSQGVGTICWVCIARDTTPGDNTTSDTIPGDTTKGTPPMGTSSQARAPALTQWIPVAASFTLAANINCVQPSCIHLGVTLIKPTQN